MSYVSSVETVILEEVLAMQEKYLGPGMSESDKEKHGFLTCSYSIAMLQEMCGEYGHIVALQNNKVIGYALVMLRGYDAPIPVVKMMFDKIGNSVWDGEPLSGVSYYTIGQICIDRLYHGTGIFQGLYNKHKELMSKHFKYCITEISGLNKRSLRAHEKVGFEVLMSYKDPSDHPWNLVIWDWRS